MKKFFPATEHNKFSPDKPLFLGMVEEKEGYDQTPKHYVKADLAEEMLEVLKKCLWVINVHSSRYDEIEKTLQDIIYNAESIIAKAEEI